MPSDWWIRPRQLLLASSAIACLGLTWQLFDSPGTIDVTHFWLPWMSSSAQVSVLPAYVQAASDYPPLSFAILWITHATGQLFGLSPFLSLKLSLLLFLSGSATLLYSWTKRTDLAIGFYAAFLVGSIGLGYLDVFVAPTLFLALWAFSNNRVAVGLLFFTATCLIKFQPLIIAPVLVLFLWRKKALTFGTAWPSLVVVAGTLWLCGEAVVAALTRAGAHQALSAQGLNANWILTFVINVSVLNRPLSDVTLVQPPILLGFLLRGVFLALYVAVLVRSSLSRLDQFVSTAALAYLTYFLINPGVHENHLALIVMLLASLSALSGPILPFVTSAVLFNANLLLFYGLRGTPPTFPGLSLIQVGVATVVTALAFFSMRSRDWSGPRYHHASNVPQA